MTTRAEEEAQEALQTAFDRLRGQVRRAEVNGTQPSGTNKETTIYLARMGASTPPKENIPRRQF